MSAIGRNSYSQEKIDIKLPKRPDSRQSRQFTMWAITHD